MKYLLDSDAARKLAQYGLYAELCSALNCSLSDFCVLPQLKFQLHLANKAKAIKKLKSAAAYDAIKTLVDHASEVEIFSTPQTEEILRLDAPNLDTGELTLFAALTHENHEKLFTGDKRALAALADQGSNATITPLWLKIVSFDEAMLIIVETADFAVVSQKIRASPPDVDTSMRIAFGSSEPASRQTVLEALNSFIADIKNKTNNKYVGSFR